MRPIAAITWGLIAVVFVLAHAPPILTKSDLFDIGIKQLVDLMADHRGPDWHWSTPRLRKAFLKNFLGQKLEVTHLGDTSFDIPGGFVVILGQATEKIL